MEKVKNLPVMRLAAFAVAVAIILGLSSALLSFTASAETVDDVVSQLGTLGNYDCIKFKLGQHMTFEFLRDIYHRFNHQYVYGVVLGYKDGKFVSISNASTRLSIKPRSSSDSSLVVSFCSVNMFESEYPGKYDVYYQHFVTNADSGKYGSTCFHSKNGTGGDAGFIVLANSYSEFINQYGDTLYLVYTASNSSWSDKQFVSLQNDIIDNLNDSNYKDIDTGTSPTAEFVTCASYTSDDNSIPLWFKDFTSEGQQYPLFTYYIHDNGNKHSYSLKLSYSSSAKDDVKKVFNLRENTKEDTDATIKDVVERIVAMYAIHGVKMHDLTPYLRTALNLKFPNNLTYNQAFVLSSPEMDFSATGNNKVYTICLSDYSDIIQCLIYKAEIIDNNTGLVLDTTYFTSKQTFNKGNSGFGSKVYDYDDRYDDMISDIKNDTPSVEPDNKGDFVADGDIIQTGRYDYYTGLKIDDIFGSLQSSASSLGSFFQACMNIIPAGILAVIIGGLSIVIILRILGR